MDREDDLFRDAMRDVAPLERRRRVVPRRVPNDDAQRRSRAAAANVPGEADPNYLTLGHVRDVGARDVLSWKKDGVQDRVFRKLRLGKYDVQGALDLHRKTVKEARDAVFAFVKLGQAKGWRTVLIAHGRGERSETPARLKSYVAHWLEQAPDVLAFHSALPRHGGTGAVYALLKKSEEHRDENRERHGQKAGDDATDPV